MIINSISLYNFRQYKGVQHIDFSHDGDKNVTVIIGQNTCGKTTLVQAFIWCLYGKSSFEDEIVLNEEVKQEILDSENFSRAKVSVQIDLTHDGIRRNIKRDSCYISNKNKNKILLDNENFSISKYENGDWRPIDGTRREFNDTIQGILPENLSDYFFFWGEKIENLSKNTNISNAVKDFLLLTTLNKVKGHLTTASNQYSKRLASQETTNNAIKLYQEKTEKCQQENKDYNDKLKAKQLDLEYYKDSIKTLEQKLMEHKVTAEKQERIKNIQSDLRILIEQEKNAESSFRKHFNNNAVDFFSSSFSKEILKMLENHENEKDAWVNVNVDTIKEILKRKECICGKKFEENDETYINLIQMLNYVTPNNISGAVEGFKSSIENRSEHVASYVQNIKIDYEKVQELKDRIFDKQSDLDQLNAELKGVEDMKAVTKKYDDYCDKRDKLLSEIGQLQQKILFNNNKIKENEARVENHFSKQDKQNFDYRCKLYVQRLIEMINKESADKEIKLKSQLEKYVQDFFNTMYSGEREVILDDKYKVQAYNIVQGKRVQSEGSPGLETVKNFAFVAGLVQIAKEKINKDDIIDAEPYPLVLDAPFSQADEKHVPAISALLTEVAEQIILVVMEKDWNYAKSQMRDKVGSYYMLSKVSETHTNIIRVEENDYAII